MMGKLPTIGILILTGLLVFTEAGPVNKIQRRNTCATQCSDTNKFNYQPGTVYEFSYDAKTTTKMNGAFKDSATMNIKAKVEIEPITKCDFVMRIKHASLRHSEDDQNSQAFKKAMTKQPLKFSFQDGRIDHICATDGEPTWTLNIKRGILSAFQNSMDSLDENQKLTETDVVGSCDSEYKILDQGRKIKLVKKTKNLLGCRNREGYRFAVQSTGYNVPSFVKSLPLMKSEYQCTQTLDLGSKILKSSECSEEHVFRPFSHGKNGAMTTTEQTLTLTNKKRAGPSSNEHFSHRSTLLFHHQHTTSNMQEKEEKIEAKLQELCQKAVENIRPEVPELVNQLIEHMRQVDRDVLSRVYKRINQKTICAHKADRIKKYFHDAIPMVGTAGSVGMIQKLISKKHVTGTEAEMWLLSLSFVHHPTKEMVAAATPLLNEHDVSGNIPLAVSSLASSYCSVRPDCGKDAEISALIGKLMALTHDCTAQNGDTRSIVFALRALGNIGNSHEAVSHLSRCLTKRGVREEIRIAAMDAFRKIPCDAMRSDLMGVFRDESEDDELRLNAYIALMKCPSREVLFDIRKVLEKEQSNQVGSFVWTHLTNLMETSHPHKKDIHSIVEDEELMKGLNLEQMKFSRNYEGSFFLDSINAGAKVDSNVIFSQKSFIPRSANLNLTIDLFGRAINFLEFGGRVQGVESIMENFFRPNGVKTKTAENFDKSVDKFRASAFLRVFGNELRYWDEESLKQLQASLHALMDLQTLSFSKSMQLLDSRMVIPTCVGLPLNLTLSATGSISFDAKASFQRPTFGLNVHIEPSASVQVKCEMSVDAHVSKAGLKMETVAHTSTGVRLDIHNNKFDLQFPQKKMEILNLRTDFYIVHRNTEKKQKMIADKIKTDVVCTSKLMKQVTGLTFCQNIKFSHASPFTGPVVYDLYMMNEDAPDGYQIEGFTNESPKSFYMDTPNSKVSRRIGIDTNIKNKNEAHITVMVPWKNIKLEGSAVNRADMKKFSGKLSFDEGMEYAMNAELGVKQIKGLWSLTPKFELTTSKDKMAFGGKIELKPMKTLMIDMTATGFTANDITLKVSGEIVPKEIGIVTQVRIGKKEYYVASRLGKLVTKSGFKYSPYLKISIPSRELVVLTSEIMYESNKKMGIDFKLDKVFPKSTAMNAVILLNAGKTKTKHTLKVSFKSPHGNFRINGDIDNDKNGLTSRVNGNFDFGGKYSDHFTLSSKLRDQSVKNSVRYTGNIALESKKQKSLNFNLKGQMAKANNHLESNFDLQYGETKTNNLKVACVLNRALKPNVHSYDYTMTIQHPGQKMDYRMEVRHLQSAAWPFKKFENTVTAQSASEDVLKTSLSYGFEKEKGMPCYTAGASLSYRGKDMKISNKLKQLDGKSFANSLDVKWQNGGHASAYSTFKKTKTGMYNTETTVTLAEQKEIKVNGMVQVTPGSYEAKVSLGADPGLITDERINYKAKAGVQYKWKATQLSTDANFDVMWAEDKKVSGSFDLKHTKGVSMSSRLLLHTPYDVMKSFDTKANLDWGKSKLSAVVTSSLNNKLVLKQDLSYAFPKHLKFAYTSHVVFQGKTSDIVIDIAQGDSHSSGSMKITKDKEIISDIAVIIAGHERTGVKDIKLNFTLLAKSGEINLKYNNDLSSIGMSYSSTLKDYKNGKMTIETKRNWPKMLKATVDLTHNNKPMFNMNAIYGKPKDTIDMKIDITEPNGKKIKVSANIDYSGSKKTASVDIKSRYITFSGDGTFEYQGTAGGEMKVRAYDKTMTVRANYNKEGTTHKVTGTLVLPDGKSLTMEGSLDLQDIAASLKTMSPAFPELTEVDMVFSFKGDGRVISSAASLKVMPYFDTAQVEMKFTKKQLNIEMKTHFESMKQAKATVTFVGDWVRSQEVKAVVQLNNEKKLDLDMDYNLKSISDFAVSMKLKMADVLMLDAMFQNTKKASKVSIDAHIMDFDEWKNTLVLKGNLDSMTAKIITSIAKKEVNRIDISLKEYGRSINVKVTGPKAISFDFNMDLDTKAITFHMDSTFTMNGREKYEMAAYYAHQSKLQIKTSIPSYTDELMITFSGKLKAFNMQTKFTHNSQIYELTLSNKEYYREMNGNLNTPYFQDTAFFKFDGEPSKMNILAQVMHNKKKFELTFSNSGYYQHIDAKLDTPYFQPTLKLNLVGNPKKFNFELTIQFEKQTYQMKASNGEYFRQMNLVLTTPVLQGDFGFEKTLDGAKGTFTVVFGNKNYDASFNVVGNLSNMKATLLYKMDGKKQFRSELLLKGYGVNANVRILNILSFEFESEWDMEKVSLNLNSNLEMHQEEIYNIVATYEHMSKLHVKASVVSYNGELMMTADKNWKLFNASLKIMPYLDTTQVEIKFTKKQFSIEMKTKHGSIQQGKFMVTFEGDWVRSEKFKGVFQLNNEKLIDFDLNYNIKSISDFAVSMDALTSHKRYKEFQFNLKNKGPLSGMNSVLKLKMANIITLDAMFQNTKKASKASVDAHILDFNGWKSTLVLKGNLDSMTAKIITSIAKKEVNRIDISLKGRGRSINVKVAGPKAVNFDFNMDLDTKAITFNMESTFTMNGRDKYEMFASYEHMSKLQIKTSIPSYKDELMITFSGKLKAFKVQTMFSHNSKVYDLVISNKQYYREMNVLLNTPYFKDTAFFKFDGELSAMNILAQVMHNKKKFELTFSNSGYYEHIDAKLDTPYYQPTLKASLTGNQKKFNFELMFHFDKEAFNCNVDLYKSGGAFNLNSKLELLGETYKIVATYEHLAKLHIKTSIPSYEDELTMTLSGTLKMFNAVAKFTHNTSKYEVIVSNKGYYRKMDAQLVTPFFTEMASFVFNGDEKTFTAQAKFMHDSDIYELVASSRKHYEELTINLSTPFTSCKLDFDFKGDLSSFKSFVTFSHNKVEYKLEVSNAGYYRNINAKLTTPSIKTEALFTLKGTLKTFTSMAEFAYNGKKYSLEISNKDYYKQMSIKLSAPFSNNNLSFSLDGNPNSFNAKLKFMHFNDLYELVVSNSGYYRNIKADLNTPFYEGSVKFSLKGDLKAFEMVTKVMHNNKKFQLTVSTANYYQQMKTELITPFYEGSVEFSLKGDFQSFDMVTKMMHNNKSFQLTVATVDYYRKIKTELTTPFYKGTVDFSLEGNLESFQMATKVMLHNGNANAVLNKEKYEVAVSTKNYAQEISGKLITPQFGKQSVSVKINGELKDFSGFIEVKNGKEIYRSEFSLTNQDFHMSLPKWVEKLQVKLDGNWKSFEFIVQIMNYSGEKYEIGATNKNFREMKAHITIPGMDDIVLFVKTNGNLRKGGASMKMTFGENIFENVVGITFDGSQASFDIEPQYKILGRSGKAKLQIDLMFEAHSYKYEFAADVEGTQFKSMASLKISPAVSFLMTVNIPTLEASEMKLRIVSKGFQKTDMILNLRSAWTGTVKVFYQHNGQVGKSFSTMSYINRDGTRLVGYSLDADFSKDYSFDFTCDFDNSTTKIDTRGKLRFQGVKTVATLVANTPFKAFKEVSVTAQSKMQRDRPSVKIEAKLPNQAYGLNVDLHDNNVAALLNLNLDTKSKDSQYQFLTSYKNTDPRDGVSRGLNIEMTLPERTVSLESRFENSQHSMVMSGLFMWDKIKDKKVGFELMVQKGRGNEAKLRIITESRTVELFGRFEVKGNRYSTVSHIMMDETKKAQKVEIKADMTILSDRADLDLTVKLPKQKKGMNLKTSIDFSKADTIVSTAFEFSIDQDPKKTLKTSAKLMSETKGERQMYTMQMGAAHAHSGFSAEVIGRLTGGPDKYNADVEIEYLDLKGVPRKLAIHGELHKIKREINLKLEAPSKKIEWNSQNLQGLNMFGYQMMTMYGKEFRTFQPSLSHMLTEFYKTMRL